MKKFLCILFIFIFVSSFGIMGCGGGGSSGGDVKDEIDVKVNLQTIQDAIEEKNASWVAAENEISKLPDSERKKLNGALIPDDNTISLKSSERVSTHFSLSATTSLPSKFDWRDFDGYDYMTEVKHQKQCGSCWAFASLGAFEALYKKVNGYEVDLSEQILVSCSGAGSCEGGYAGKACDYLKNNGIPQESYFPYEGKDASCENAISGWDNSKYQIDDWEWICGATPNTAQIKQALMKSPVIAVMKIYQDFYYYDGGIYSHVYGDFEDNHVVVIVGYDDSKSYWICKNSWGSSWGRQEGGYFKIKYGDSSIGMHSIALSLSTSDTIDPTNPDIPDGETLTNSLGMTFVYIPPGTFMMGSLEDDPGSYGYDRPRHQVTLTKGYYLQTTEVTQYQWEAVMGKNPSYFSSCGDDCPVENVSWNKVQEFISALNAREGTIKYRLPTEAEWEYAARAGTTTPFAFGNCLLTSQANYRGDDPLTGCPSGEYRSRTVPVASFAPNAWGLYDMHGNVCEWCSDEYGSYPSYPVTDPTGPSYGPYFRVWRGGSWYHGAGYCRSAYRDSRGATNDDYYIGFRLALSGTDSIGNLSPTAIISSPTDNSTFNSGQNISFAGTGSDPEDGTLPASAFVWTSSLDGEIQTGRKSFSISSLSAGTHTITLTVTDSSETKGNASITVVIEADDEDCYKNYASQLNGGVATSSTYGCYHGCRYAHYANDDEEDTFWAGTQYSGDWLKIEFKDRYNIDKIVIGINYHTVSYNIELSTDGINWTRVVGTTTSDNATEHDTVMTHNISSTPANYLRINILDSNSPGSHIFKSSIPEIQAWGECRSPNPGESTTYFDDFNNDNSELYTYDISPYQSSMNPSWTYEISVNTAEKYLKAYLNTDGTYAYSIVRRKTNYIIPPGIDFDIETETYAWGTWRDSVVGGFELWNGSDREKFLSFHRSQWGSNNTVSLNTHDKSIKVIDRGPNFQTGWKRLRIVRIGNLYRTWFNGALYWEGNIQELEGESLYIGLWNARTSGPTGTAERRYNYLKVKIGS
jgi:formylglycine-generating enzyme required for sulfatase activity